MGERVTYFEVLTALAFLVFADAPAGLGVFEVGMGGKWDATNVIAGDVAVLCPIALDHPELGATITEKAVEKAAIIKEGKTAVCREQPADALAIIKARASEVDARLLLEDTDFHWEDRQPAVGGQVLSVRTPYAAYEELLLTIYGEHAARNAATAIVALESLLGRALDEEAVRETFAEASSPGRMEILSRHPLVILDGAHNPAGAGALVEALEEGFTWDRLLMVMAISADKDLEGIIGSFETIATEAFVTRYAGPRAYAPQVLASACRDAGIPAVAFDSVDEALTTAAANATEADVILVTGSLYTVAEARRILTKS
jgi:dihydrofolate synthase/folylpolyglutamate synthase